jgi:hypothetical protein
LLSFLSLLAIAGCAPAPVSDSEAIAMLNSDRPGFEQAVEDMSRPSQISEIMVRADSVEVSPTSADPARVERLRHFMISHAISRISHHEGTTSFVVSSSGLGVSGTMKSLVFEATGLMTESGAGDAVSDTDVAVRAKREQSVLAYRKVGDGWFIRNSS